MDPLSIISGVTGTCAIGAKIIYKISSCINEIKDAPTVVQELSVELSAVYFVLGQLKILVENPMRHSYDGFQKWAADFELILADCDVTFTKIEKLLDNSKLKTKESAKGQIVKRIKWVWEDKVKDVAILKARLEGYKTTLLLMLEVLNCYQQDTADEKIQAIHAAVEKLLQDRENTTETFVVLAPGHSAYEETELVLTDRRGNVGPNSSAEREALAKENEELRSSLQKKDEELQSVIHKGQEMLNQKEDALRNALDGLSTMGVALTEKDSMIAKAIEDDQKSLARCIAEAAANGHTSQVRDRLVGPDVNFKYAGWTALGKAARFGHLETVRLLVDRGANLEVAMDKGWGVLPGDGTALNWAAFGGHTDTVKFLIEKGASMYYNAKKPALFGTGGTPIVMAAGSGHLDVVRLLLRSGADIRSEEGITGWAAFTCACETGQVAIVKYFVEEQGFRLNTWGRSSKMTALHFAAAGGQKKTMEYLVKRGADLDSRDVNGWTPLHFAVKEGQRQAVVWLRVNGAKIDVLDNAGKTPLDLAKSENKESMVETLQKELTKEDEGSCTLM